jgi:iron complex outermembrane receptor protein
MTPASVRHAAVPIALALLALAAAPAPSPAARAVSAGEPTSGDTLGHVVEMPEVVVSTTRPGERAPLARASLSRTELAERNIGQDTGMLLATLPGAYAYSDAGNGIGYSYLSIRGFPQRRISVLIDGVPLNDPESHEVYWIDHPDLMASSSEAQVQRGVGSALYGAASLGGSVNIETAPFSAAPQASATYAYGSYDTKRLMLETNSGLLEGGWNLYGRYSRVESRGYRDQSWSKLWSYTLAARRVAGAHRIQANLYGGPEETHLAYLGVPGAYLRGEITGDPERDRRFNPLTYANERDHFFEPHYELIHTWTPRAGLTFSQTLFYFDGRGYYDEQRAAQSLADYRLAPWATTDSLPLPATYYERYHWVHRSPSDSFAVADRDPATGKFTVQLADLVRRRTVANRHFGWVPRARLDHPDGTLTLGGELRSHDGRHWGEVLTGNGLPPATEPDHTYYDYHPRTLSGGLFAREEWRWHPRFQLTADFAWRHESYYMRGDHFDGIRFDQPYNFATPRLGLTWSPSENANAFASWARSSREPAFRDLYDAEGVGSAPLYRVVNVAAGVYRDPLIHPEKVDDYEVGGAWRGTGVSLSANLFRMNFHDELVTAGQNTDLGSPILGNAARSVHQGLELSGRAERDLAAGSALTLGGNLSLSDNHFVEYREVSGPGPQDVVRYDGKAIGFFPAVLGNVNAQWKWRRLSLGADVQHAGRIYLDNTETRTASLAPRTIANATAGYRLPLPGGAAAEAELRVLNAFDREYEAGGYMDYDTSGTLAPMFIPAAKRSVLFQVRMEFR